MNVGAEVEPREQRTFDAGGPFSAPVLRSVRVLTAISGIELFGHERGNIEVFKALRSLGAEVRVGINARDGGGEVRSELQDLGFETFSLPFGVQWSKRFLRDSPFIAATNLGAVIRCSRLLLKEVKKWKATHIHIGSPLVFSFLSLALIRSRVPLIYRVGDTPPVDSPFNLWVWKRAVARADLIVANSRFVRNRAESEGAESSKLSVVYGAAPSRAAASREDRTQCSRTGPEGRRLLYVGSIAEHKGVLHLVEAFSSVAAKLADLSLDIAGGSQYDLEYRRRVEAAVAALGVQGRVELLGYVRDPGSLLRRASLCIVPSIWEEPGANVVLEAKHEGVPCVAFPSGSLPEMVNHQVDGFVCRERSVSALIEGIEWMLADTARLDRMGQRARADYEARFGPERFRAEWADVYRRAWRGGKSAERIASC